MTGNKNSNQKNDNNIFFSSDSKGIIKIFNLPSNEEFMLKGHMSDNDNNYILKSWQAHNDSIWNMHYKETEVNYIYIYFLKKNLIVEYSLFRGIRWNY